MKNYFSRMIMTLLLFTTPAFAGIKMAVVGGVDYNLNSSSATVGATTATVKGGLGFGGGVLLGVGSFETGAIYLSKKITTTVTGLPDVSTNVTGVEVPIIARIGGGAATFGIGGFIDLASTTNYGLTAGPRFGGNNGGPFLDLRFNYGLKSGNSQDLLGLVGYAFNSK